MTDEQLLEKWKILINACKDYYVDCKPTGLQDSEFDELERRAFEEDGFYARDYVFDKYLKGVKTKNKYIEKIVKEKVTGKTMLDALIEKNPDYALLKYDGSSIAIYIDSETGTPRRIVTAGNTNREDFGVDQTAKLINLVPKKFPKGIVAIQCEALVDVTKIDTPDRARQKANGIINSKYREDDVNSLLTLRCYRYYCDDTPNGISVSSMNYKDVLSSFETVISNVDGHVLFAPADIFTIDELKSMNNYCETDCTVTTTGTFLNDGWVCYDKHGVCQGALKFAGAGSDTEGVIKTKVLSIKWNDQTSKGKDSWSANVIVEPVNIRGSEVRKPSGSANKIFTNTISNGAEVSIVLANSTIPMVDKTFSPGDGNFNWPVCTCGYHLSEKDIFGSLLKCGNPECTKRTERMSTYVNSLDNIYSLDLNKLLAIDRFKWENTTVDIMTLINYVKSGDMVGYHDYLLSYMSTELQIRILELVWKSSWIALYNSWQDNLKS